MWVNAHLGTKSRKAKRTVIYTFDISEPATGSGPRTLAAVSVPVGVVTPGTEIEDESQLGRSEWISVPDISANAARAYERDNALHKDLYAELQALERSVKRNQRVLEGMEARMSDASDDAQEKMKSRMANLEYRVLHMESMLDARRLEYDELPKPTRYYMPVTIGVGLIESRSERRALATLGAFLEDHRVEIVDKAESMAFERSADLLDSDSSTLSLEQARERYYDAVIAVEEARSVEDSDIEAAEDDLVMARNTYNELRLQAEIPAIE